MIIIGITNRKLCLDFYEQIRKIAKSKINYLIVREKDLESEELLETALKVKRELENTDIKIIINSNEEIAERVNADGIQLSFKDFLGIMEKFYTENLKSMKATGDNFRFRGQKYKKYKIIGVSIHSFDEGIQAYNLGADYVIYGHVFETDCKKGVPPRGIKEIEKLSKEIDIPVIGLGGIDKSNFKEVINSGAGGIAIMSSLMKAESPEALIEDMIG